MKRANLELGVGIFVLLGLACITYLAVHLGEMEIFGRGYRVIADFDNISGLKVGALVEVAGVEVGRVEGIQVTSGSQARLVMKMKPNLIIHDDAMASIRTKGIIGDKFVKLSLGNSGNIVPPGGKIRDTEPAVEWEELLSKYIHGKV
ncbi:MAG: outer membrane lipid asymmetry maintenance protein MlaD [Deltaproteobacteria bacterium RBG_13_58_19]|nr:MAG: outer membrane lipid asymmetry maintenance protein MlaD [Deltaproteobacteria bacterium RBG_13_58_19]